MNIGYTNRELKDMLAKGGYGLSQRTIYYFSTEKLPDNMIQKHMFPDRYVYNFKMNGVLYSSERQCVSFLLACLLDDGLMNGVDAEYVSSLRNGGMRYEVYHSDTPCSASSSLKRFRILDPYDRKLMDDWSPFLHLLACRYKFSCMGNSGKCNETLMSTGDKFLCYANINDGVYGINMSANDAAMRMKSPDDWRGANLHGRILMTVRDNMRSVPISVIPKDLDNRTRIVVRCPRPGLLIPHVDMCAYLMGLEDGSVTVMDSGNKNVRNLYDIDMFIARSKSAGSIIERFRRMLREYPSLEIV